jgi:hypothetical protein
MDVTFNKLYLYDHVWQLLAVGDTFCPCKDNGPMSNLQPLKAHKGIDNKLIFRVLGPDRVPLDISCDQQVYARIIDPDNRMVVLEKLCRLGPAKGLISLELDSGDIVDIHAGLYNIVLIRTQEFVDGIPGYYVEKPLYSDMNDNVAMELEITEQAFKAPARSVTILPEDWTSDILVPTFGPPAPCFYTSRIPASRVQNHKESVHSFSTYTIKATGVLEIWGTLEETPDPYLHGSRWFPIFPSSMSTDIEFIGYTGTQAWTFSANFMWLKFRWFPSQEVLDPGILQKLIVRT